MLSIVILAFSLILYDLEIVTHMGGRKNKTAETWAYFYYQDNFFQLDLCVPPLPLNSLLLAILTKTWVNFFGGRYLKELVAGLYPIVALSLYPWRNECINRDSK